MPDNLYRTDVAGADQLVRDVLPESRDATAEYLNADYDPNLRLTEDAVLSVTFIAEGASFRNTLGYFSYADNVFSGLTKADDDTNASGVVDYDELIALNDVSADIVFSNASIDGAGCLLNASIHRR